jgi:archaellum biogenesis ATPase FlaH
MPNGKKDMAIERYQNGEKKFDLPDEFRLPYNLPKVREAIEKGKTIYFVEGESDADALEANDYTATCVPFGAGGWNKRYVEHFKGASICFIPDNDNAGKELPLKAIPDLLSVAKEVKVIELSDAKDVRDLINTKGIEAFQSLTPIDANQYLEKHKLSEKYPLQSLNGTPQQPQTHNGTQAQPKLLLTKPVCSWINEANSQPPITHLFDVFWLSGELAFLFGSTNVGKTILAVQLLDAISKGAKIQGFDGVQKPMKVCLFDFELSARQFLKRYSDGSGNIHDFSPNFLRTEIDANAEIPKGISYQDYILAQIEQTIIEHRIEVAVIDNLTALLSNITETKDALELMHKLRLLKLRQNISMLVLSHSPKRDLSRPITKHDMVGSMHLLNLCDSAFAIGESVKESNVRYVKQVKTRSAEFKYDSENVAVFRLVKYDRFIGFEHTRFDDEKEYLRERNNNELSELEMNIHALHQSEPNLSYSEIAKQLNTSKAKVCRVLKKASNGTLNTSTPF